LIEIDVPLSRDMMGGDEMKIVLQGEHGTKHYFIARNMPASGQCRVFVALEAPGISVAPGVDYVLEVRGLRGTTGGWNLNTTGASGEYTT
jgi:hypothetical protein